MNLQLPKIRWNVLRLPFLSPARAGLRASVGAHLSEQYSHAESHHQAEPRHEASQHTVRQAPPPQGAAPAADPPEYAALVLQHTPELIALIDRNGIYRFVTPSYQQIGYTAADLVGRPIAAVLHPDDARLFDHTASDGAITLRLRTGDGEWRCMAGETRSVEHGSETLRMLIIRDLPSMPAPHDDLRRTQRTLVLGALATGMIHDLNNMLTIIAGNADIVAEALPANHPAQTDLATISAITAHAGSLTNQVAGYVAAAHQERRNIQLGSWLEEQRLLISRLAGPLVQVAFDSAPDLWLIDVAPSELTEVLLSLIADACAAMTAGGRITLSARNAPAGTMDGATGAAVLIEISAVAVGRNGKAHDPRVQLNGVTPVPPLRALSLASCQWIIEAHGGLLQGADAVGQGTTWRILLPRAAAD